MVELKILKLVSHCYKYNILNFYINKNKNYRNKYLSDILRLFIKLKSNSITNK